MKYYIGTMVCEAGDLEVYEKIAFKLDDAADPDEYMDKAASKFFGEHIEHDTEGYWDTYYFADGQGGLVNCWWGMAQEVPQNIYEYLIADRPEGSILEEHK